MGLAAIFVLFIPVIFLSRWVTKPVQVAFDKQKQFIADASHELKTPLTIITTNAEVLQRELPDNKWLVYILEQTGRMKNLINSLLELFANKAGRGYSYPFGPDVGIDLSMGISFGRWDIGFIYERGFTDMSDVRFPLHNQRLTVYAAFKLFHF